MNAVLAQSTVEMVTDAPAARSLTLDITRLLSRGLHEAPTGIDRVELAYARALLAAPGREVRFEAWVPGIGFTRYATDAVERLLATLDARWMAGRGLTAGEAARAATGFRPGGRIGNGVHLIVSHQHLADLERRIRRSAGARTCVYVHDTIPSDFPEYARPGGAALHDRRMRNAVALADAVIVNSQATSRSLERFILASGRRPRVLVAPLGVEPRFAAVAAGPAPFDDTRPYFLCVGTIEPRKNHLLLLQLWRAMAARAPTDTLPRLVLVGRRGWENENIVDLLDRSAALKNLVVEAGQVGDARLAQLLTHARAVLMPSFAEGFGLPVAEALAAGVPVIASDIPVLRETGGDAPDYLDPLDGPGWAQAIADHAREDSAMRAAQLRRIAGWRTPGWNAHFNTVLPFLDAL